MVEEVQLEDAFEISVPQLEILRLSGIDFAAHVREALEKAGVNVFSPVSFIRDDEEAPRLVFTGPLVDTTVVETRHVINASNGRVPLATVRALGAEELIGRFVSTTAWSDSQFCVGKRVAVLGNGCWAKEQANIAAKCAAHVTVLLETEALPTDCSALRMPAHVSVLPHALATGVSIVDRELECLTLEAMVSNDLARFSFDFLFVAPDPEEWIDLSARTILRAGIPNGIPYRAHELLYDDGVRTAQRIRAYL